MEIVLWIIAGLLAVAFLFAGANKVLQPKEKLLASGMHWVEGTNPGLVKLLGGLEVLAAIGLILPAILDIAPVLVPLAALGLVVVMIGAIVVHARRKEVQSVVMNIVLLVLAAVVVWGRFGPYSFSS
ncbi:DoxX family protein [Micromonospora sp. NPDC003197]